MSSAKSGFTNSRSKEHITKRGGPVQAHLKLTSAQPTAGPSKKGKGFHIASPSSDGHPSDDEDDSSEWVSSESGAATPNRQAGDSSDSEEGDTPVEEKPQNTQHSDGRRPLMPRWEASTDGRETPTPQVYNARPADPPASDHKHRPNSEPMLSVIVQNATPSPGLSDTNDTVHDLPSPTRSVKRGTRPPSMHSTYSKIDVPLRPHPLFRGLSSGQPSAPFAPKPSPLAPLTVTADVISSSPQTGTVLHESMGGPGAAPYDMPRSSSPTSPYSSSIRRRGSVSSTRSVATLPISSTSTFAAAPSRAHVDRHRTLSTLSATSASSAAISSLAHITKPNAQMPSHSQPHPSTPHWHPKLTSFFPSTTFPGHGYQCAGLDISRIDTIHPLLPGPYTARHGSTLMSRQPLRESFDRVVNARVKAGIHG